MIDGTTEDYNYDIDMSVFMQNAIPIAKM